MSTRRLPALPVTQNKARFPVPTLGTQFLPILFTPHQQKPQHTAVNQQHKFTPQHCLYVATYPFAIQKLHSQTENSLKLTSLQRLFNWTAAVWLSLVTEWVGWVGFKYQHGQAKGWRNQPIRTQLQQGPLLGKSKASVYTLYWEML